MPRSITRLTAADELLIHQIPNTFATVNTSDYSWTEKIWATLMRKDGKLQADFGLGKYANRGIMDGFAGTCRGIEQRTVRASRLLDSDPEAMRVGPISYEIVEPLNKVRFKLGENDFQPLQFDLLFEGRLPAFFEGRDLRHEPGRGRMSSDVVRYHQPGTVSGWVLLEGERIEVRPEEWYGFRDHSWGTREHAGLDPTDLAPHHHDLFTQAFYFNWFVSQIQRPDGSFYEMMYYFQEFSRGVEHYTGFINEADGTQVPIVKVWPDIEYRARDHAPMRGTIHVATEDPAGGRKFVERTFEIECIDPDIGFRLNTGLYMPWKGMVHGSYKGELHVDGECVDDCDSAFTLENNPGWQVRDRPMRVREGDNHGFADLESGVVGDWPNVKIV